MKICTYEGCGRRMRSRGLCASHWRMRDAGKPLRPVKPYKRYPAPAPGKKICTGCEKVKDVEDFNKRANGKPLNICKECGKARQKVYNRRLRERRQSGAVDSPQASTNNEGYTDTQTIKEAV